MENEVILCESGSRDAWVCLCGNTPDSDGFFTCDENGAEVEPTEVEWKTGWYVCICCGRIIDPKTLKVVGRKTR